jgi:hypothetical protein
MGGNTVRSSTIGKLLWGALAFVAIWALAYAGVWLHISGCMAGFDIQCMNAPAAPLVYLISLHWAGDHPELTAGILTFLGATTAVIAVVIQIGHNQSLADAERRVRHKGILARILMKWRTIYQDFRFGDFDECLRSIDELEDLCADLADFAPDLAQWTQLVALYPLRHSRTAKTESLPSYRIDQTIQSITAAQYFFDDFDRLLDQSGNYVHVPASKSEALRLFYASADEGAELNALPEVYADYFS